MRCQCRVTWLVLRPVVAHRQGTSATAGRGRTAAGSRPGCRCWCPSPTGAAHSSCPENERRATRRDAGPVLSTTLTARGSGPESDACGLRASPHGWRVTQSATTTSTPRSTRPLPPCLRRDPSRRERRAAAGFLARAAAFYASHGIRIERELSDDAFCYRNSQAFKTTAADLGIVQKFHLTTLAVGPRQGRAAQPHPRRGMGVLPTMDLQHRARGRLAYLAQALQPSPTPSWHRGGLRPIDRINNATSQYS